MDRRSAGDYVPGAVFAFCAGLWGGAASVRHGQPLGRPEEECGGHSEFAHIPGGEGRDFGEERGKTAGAVRRAAENEITAGTGPKTFGPDDPCTRGQIVSFLFRSKK